MSRNDRTDRRKSRRPETTRKGLDTRRGPMNRGRRLAALCAVLLAAGILAACGGSGEQETAATTTPPEEQPSPEASSTQVSITARDYAFDVPASFEGGLTRFSFTNAGQEPHFAGLARMASGKTFEDVKAALTTPPSAAPGPGAPPFEEVGGFPTADPGAVGSMTVNLPAGNYVFYCLLPSADGVPHGAKGMITEVHVTEGPEGELPAAAGTVTAVDFALAPLPELEVGDNVVRLRNEGQQLHEINLVELAPGKEIDDAVAWFRQQDSPPPMRFLAGVAVKPGSDATTQLNLKAGSTYAFICAIPDLVGDLAPHVTKGMFTSAFTVA